MQKQLAAIATDDYPPGSDTVFHWAALPRLREARHPDSPLEQHLRQYCKKILQLASPTAMCMLLQQFQVNQVIRMAATCLESADDLARVAMAGYWFECLAHTALAAGGPFTCRLISKAPGDADFTINLPRVSTVNRYSSNLELSRSWSPDLTTYCMPRSRRAAALDSASSAGVWYQVGGTPRQVAPELRTRHVAFGMR